MSSDNGLLVHIGLLREEIDARIARLESIHMRKESKVSEELLSYQIRLEKTSELLILLYQYFSRRAGDDCEYGCFESQRFV